MTLEEYRKKTGGQAFPDVVGGSGMTLRDWFASQALNGGLSSSAQEWELIAWFGKHATGVTGSQILAARAYDIADAMMDRRSKLTNTE